MWLEVNEYVFAWNMDNIPNNYLGVIGGVCRLKHRTNTWLLTSVENQEQAYERIPHLLKCRDLSPVLGLSCEPLLGRIDLSHCLGTLQPSEHGKHNWCERGIDWVIGGGESGPNARTMHPDWARSLRDQCVSAGVPFFFKQWGEWGAVHHPIGGPADQAINGQLDCRYGEFHDGEFVEDCLCMTGSGTVARVGKKAAGRILDGQEWSQFPEVTR